MQRMNLYQSLYKKNCMENLSTQVRFSQYRSQKFRISFSNGDTSWFAEVFWETPEGDRDFAVFPACKKKAV